MGAGAKRRAVGEAFGGARSLSRRTGRRWRRTVLSRAGRYYPSVEGAEPDEAVPKKKPLDIESVYYAQHGLLQAALDRVRFSSDDLAEIYFVGFAPDAAEDVFESEVKHVEALFRERLGAQGRTVLLINSRSTVDELPLANGASRAYSPSGTPRRWQPCHRRRRSSIVRPSAR